MSFQQRFGIISLYYKIGGGRLEQRAKNETIDIAMRKQGHTQARYDHIFFKIKVFFILTDMKAKEQTPGK